MLLLMVEGIIRGSWLGEKGGERRDDINKLVNKCCFDDEMIDEGGIKCPNCGENLEFDFSCDECGDCDEEE